MICSRKEFYTMAGCSKANLSTYIKRGNVVLMGDGKNIDTDNPANKSFLEKRQDTGKAVSLIPEAKPVTPTAQAPIATPSKSLTASEKKVQRAADDATITKYAIEKQKAQADLDKKLIDTELARQKLSVLMGNNIPVDMVKDLVAQFSKAILSNYKSFSEQQITETCHKNGIPEVERVKLIAKNISGLNGIHNKAVNDARTQMKNSVGQSKMDELDNEDVDN